MIWSDGRTAAIELKHGTYKVFGRSYKLEPTTPISFAWDPDPRAASQTVVGAASATPDWADPNVPFLSRSEAEANLRAVGMTDGSYVVRQTTSTPRGYVITSVFNGEFTNSQLKSTSGMLHYGAKAVGSTLAEAINSLKTAVKIASRGGPPYNLSFEFGKTVQTLAGVEEAGQVLVWRTTDPDPRNREIRWRTCDETVQWRRGGVCPFVAAQGTAQRSRRHARTAMVDC